MRRNIPESTSRAICFGRLLSLGVAVLTDCERCVYRREAV